MNNNFFDCDAKIYIQHYSFLSVYLPTGKIVENQL